MRALEDSLSEEVVDVDDADGFILIDDEQGGDLGFLHQFEGGGSDHIAADGFGVRRHDVLSLFCEEVVSDVASEVAIGDDADEAAIFVGDADASHSFGGDGEEGVGHVC